ncbi:MAG: hypothetical protein IJ812_00680 [Schwartzia sp.]|nr:hypothetical protein [Schwartzia sp. (in: firmicutes)]MBR1761336.1 hypothetical protein [Schwartzia sp. (in: firmicutes)]MBR1884898.1 hypothetical protein [Schwartzia sp. (in: firmicutes)]
MKTLTKKSERRRLALDYIRQHNPQQPTQKFGYDVAAISRYAREKKIAISEIPVEELEQFSVP